MFQEKHPYNYNLDLNQKLPLIVQQTQSPNITKVHICKA